MIIKQKSSMIKESHDILLKYSFGSCVFKDTYSCIYMYINFAEAFTRGCVLICYREIKALQEIGDNPYVSTVTKFYKCVTVLVNSVTINLSFIWMRTICKPFVYFQF